MHIYMCMHLFVYVDDRYIVFIWTRSLLYSQGYPGTHYVARDDLEFEAIFLPQPSYISLMLGFIDICHHTDLKVFQFLLVLVSYTHGLLVCSWILYSKFSCYFLTSYCKNNYILRSQKNLRPPFLIFMIQPSHFQLYI